MIDPHTIRKEAIEYAMINDAEDRAAQPLSKIAQLEQLVSNLRRDLQVSHQALMKAHGPQWKPISELDKSSMHFVLVHQDGAIRLRLWNPKGYWEFSDLFGGRVDARLSECGEPTHWLEIPEKP